MVYLTCRLNTKERKEGRGPRRIAPLRVNKQRPLRQGKGEMGATDQLSATFAALADPTRRAILARLATGEASVTELAEPFEISLPAVSKHLKVLERSGLIARGRDAQWRPCRLEAKPLAEADAWLERYRKFWEARFRRLDAVLEELMAEEKRAATKKKRRKQP